jgi:hypothetical protein
MRPKQTVILSVVLALQVGWALSGCGSVGNDSGSASSAGASGATTSGGEESAGNASAGASAGSAEPTGGGSSSAGGSANMGGEGESAGSSNAGAGGTGGTCVTPGGDLRTCVLDQQNKRDVATTCSPSAPDQCQDRITNDCGCQIAVNDADSPEVACYLAALAEGSCSLCTPEPCAQPLGECEVGRDGPTFCR